MAGIEKNATNLERIKITGLFNEYTFDINC